jgi:hypothetical protein
MPGFIKPENPNLLPKSTTIITHPEPNLDPSTFPDGGVPVQHSFLLLICYVFSSI